MFVCGGPVKVLEVNPCDPKEFVCGDSRVSCTSCLGKVDFLNINQRTQSLVACHYSYICNL